MTQIIQHPPKYYKIPYIAIARSVKNGHLAKNIRLGPNINDDTVIQKMKGCLKQEVSGDSTDPLISLHQRSPKLTLIPPSPFSKPPSLPFPFFIPNPELLLRIMHATNAALVWVSRPSTPQDL